LLFFQIVSNRKLAAMNTDIQVSEKNRQWLREVETTAKNLEASTSSSGFAPELRVLTDSVCKFNENLGVLNILGGGPPEPEFDSIIGTIVQDFRILLPRVRTIYEARKDAWFITNNVLKHGFCHARTWHDIVLRNAEEVTEGSRLITARHACRLLHDSEYESDKIQIHLELEFEYAGKAIQTGEGRTGPKQYSLFREPQEWLRLRKLKGLSHSRNTWPALVKRYGADIDCESTKSARINVTLAQEWGLKLPEFHE
jgi:hypothetical protein